MTRHLAKKNNNKNKSMVHRRAFQKFRCREICNPIFPTESYFPTTYSLFRQTSSEASEKLKCIIQKEKTKKCIVCDILTSTATGSFHERFSVIEVNEQKSGDLSRRDLHGVNAQVFRAWLCHHPAQQDVDTTRKLLTPLACCATGAPFWHHPAASWHRGYFL